MPSMYILLVSEEAVNRSCRNSEARESLPHSKLHRPSCSAYLAHGRPGLNFYNDLIRPPASSKRCTRGGVVAGAIPQRRGFLAHATPAVVKSQALPFPDGGHPPAALISDLDGTLTETELLKVCSSEIERNGWGD